ncbi:Niemann-Pick C1 protein isoform X2 [Orussus abietinus]|nr:Niemann-Pick C1 protein isoform X2 [Orussus abietinus]
MNETKFEPAVHAPSDLYCEMVNSFPSACLVLSILDIWEYNSTFIAQQTKNDIIWKFNSQSISPTLGHPINFAELLGGITRDSSGRIISAKAVKTMWMVHVNFTTVNMDKIGNDIGTADWATENVLAWESAFLRELEINAEIIKLRNSSGRNWALWYEAGRSFGDVSSAAMFQDMDKIIAGTAMMSIYVQVILSDFNWVEWRFWLTTAGLLCIGGAFIIAVGVCSLIGVPYGPVHTSLPFMLMSLGIDDMFVVMASWKQVLSNKCNINKPLPERVGLMLSHAGTAISITSLTDVVAFIIGASTILPSLESFCIYAAMGVFVTFLLQLTFFVGFFTLDAKRIEAKQNGILPCIVHRNFEPTAINENRQFSWKIMNCIYSKVVLTLPGKIIILLMTAGIASFGVMGSLNLEQWFDPDWFLPNDTYLSNYIHQRNLHYPKLGQVGFVVMGDIDYVFELPRIVTLTETLANLSFVQTVEPWPLDFVKFVKTYYNKDAKSKNLSEEDFGNYLSRFLFSRDGGKYQRNFLFDRKLTCGKGAPKILIASIDFKFYMFSGPHEWIPAMDEVKQVVANVGIEGFVTVWAKAFATWVTDKVISREVSRNLVLALICVMGTTAILIAEPQTCFWILLCVLLTLLDVCGFMYYWGLTIDIASCIGLELAIGLSVDYAAHVAHAFLNTSSHDGKRDRQTRTLVAVRHIGAAVIFGAGSTLLALSLLSFSQAYVFRAFFKIFVLVVVFGLWHGLFLLPVVLSTLGPRSLHKEDRGQKREGSPEDLDPEVRSPLRTVPES